MLTIIGGSCFLVRSSFVNPKHGSLNPGPPPITGRSCVGPDSVRQLQPWLWDQLSALCSVHEAARCLQTPPSPPPPHLIGWLTPCARLDRLTPTSTPTSLVKQVASWPSEENNACPWTIRTHRLQVNPKEPLAPASTRRTIADIHRVLSPGQGLHWVLSRHVLYS